jgi:PAS domain S-box-containing protein
MGDKPKILIVEDDSDSALLLETILEDIGYNILGIAETGEDAIKMSSEMMPDVILMDIALKGNMDGVETAGRIDKEFGIPFVYITAGTDDRTFTRAKETMPLGYILKPYDRNIIKSSIEMGLYRREIEKKLEKSERRNRDILSNIPDVVFRLDSSGSFIDNKDRETAKKIWSKKVSKKAIPVITRAIKDGNQELFEYQLKKKEGRKYYEARINKARSTRVLVIVRDVTARKIAENKLNEYKENLEKIVEERVRELGVASEYLNTFKHAIDQSPNSVVILTRDGNVDYINKKFKDLSGYSTEDLIGIDVGKDANPIFPEPELWNSIKSLDHWKGEIYNLNREGNLFYGDANAVSIEDENGKVTHYILQIVDITHKKNEEREIKEVRKILDKTDIRSIDMEMDWQEWKEKILSRNISRTDKSLFRNINNSFTQGAGLGSLISLLYMMSAGLEKDGDKYRVDASLFDLIIENVRIAENAFKMFSNLDWIISNDFALEKITVIELHNFINVVINKASEFLNIKRQKIIISELSALTKSLMIDINKEYFYKAVYEILINAMKFSRSDTNIIIMIRSYGRNVIINFINDPEKGENNTLGIPAEYEKVVFEPFYRLSKLVYEQYKSLDFGLGLTLIEKIVSKHGGEIKLANIKDHSDLKREPQLKVSLTILLPIRKN